MKQLALLCVVSLFLGMTPATLSARQDRDRAESVQNRLIGAWRLVWLEERGADGKIRRADCTGLLVYSRDGHMVLVTERGCEVLTPTSKELVAI